MTQRDFVELTKRYVYIENYKSLGLKLDEEIMEVCKDRLYFPYKEMKTPIVNALIDFAKHQDITRLNMVAKRYNIVPDATFAQLVLMTDQKICKIIPYLVKVYGVKLNECCIYWALTRGWTSKALEKLAGVRLAEYV